MKKDIRIGSGYHVLAKPRGAVCNLGCEYCFYLEKKELYPQQKRFQMSDDILERFVKEYIQSQDIPEIQFVWQGGEPLLSGIDFYEKVISYQKKYMGGKKITNSMQTNGILLDEGWCAFLKKYGFFVGISLDGPEHIHDRYRKDLNRQGTYQKVTQAISLLQKWDIPYNVLACVTKDSCSAGVEIYEHLKDLGVQFIQFTPIVERFGDDNGELKVSDYSVIPAEYGKFLIDIFEKWVRHDVGDIHVMNFEWALESWMGLPSTICIFSKECGRALAIEHNGDIYSCDHYVSAETLLGNITQTSLPSLVNSPEQQAFGKAKSATLSTSCENCEVLFACQGECPRHRFVDVPGTDGEKISYLCGAYKMYFRHIHRYMKVMAQLVSSGHPASLVMEAIKGPLILKNS